MKKYEIRRSIRSGEIKRLDQEQLSNNNGNGTGNNTGIAGIPITYEQIARFDGAYEIITNHNIYSLGHALYINGLRQSINSYSISGTNVIIPSELNIMAGDTITFNFFSL